MTIIFVFLTFMLFIGIGLIIEVIERREKRKDCVQSTLLRKVHLISN